MTESKFPFEGSEQKSERPKEIERKFLIKDLPVNLEDYVNRLINQGYCHMDEGGGELEVRQIGDDYNLAIQGGRDRMGQKIEIRLSIEQTEQFRAYFQNIDKIIIRKNGEMRVRQKGDNYFLTIKSAGDLVREEFEIDLEKEQFDIIWPSTEGKRVFKRRYNIPLEGVKNNLIELDVYQGGLAGLYVVEVEFDTEEDAENFMPPTWFGREITKDKNYKNQRLAVSGLPEEYREVEVSASAEINKRLETFFARAVVTMAGRKDQVQLYKEFSLALYDMLPAEEQKKFLDNPIDFVSGLYLFRSLAPYKVSTLLREEIMKPVFGDYAGPGVFVTDSPYAASSFINRSGFLVVIDRAKIVHMSDDKKIWDAASLEFNQKVEDYIKTLPIGQQKSARWTVHYQWDIAEKMTIGKPWQNFVLRRSQPLSAIKGLIFIDEADGKTDLLDPNNVADRQKLDKLLSPRR